MCCMKRLCRGTRSRRRMGNNDVKEQPLAGKNHFTIWGSLLPINRAWFDPHRGASFAEEVRCQPNNSIMPVSKCCGAEPLAGQEMRIMDSRNFFTTLTEKGQIRQGRKASPEA